jgi:hypothetical protein
MRVIFALTLAGCVGLLMMAVWPGLVEGGEFSFLCVCLSLPLMGVWFVLLVVLTVLDLARKPPPPDRLRWGLLSMVILLLTWGMLWVNAPQRVAFALCHGELSDFVDAAPVGESGGRELGRRVGPYRIDRYGADSCGGVYFRTGTGPDGIGPDTMSYGFAFRPNRQGSTPFGKSRCRLSHLFGDWYTFEVSDD